MELQRIIQGRVITTRDILVINQMIADNPNWHRTRLSKELCTHWQWISGNGQLKDMAARSLLRKLDNLGAIKLPPARHNGNNEYRGTKRVGIVDIDTTPITGRLASVQPISLQKIIHKTDVRIFRYLLTRYHYLGYRGPVGENVTYMIVSSSGRPLGCLLFGAAAWKVMSRDHYIGWSVDQRRYGLPLIAGNHRFLLLPWVSVPHLASHVLGKVARRISNDWQEKYGHPIVLLETFVQKNKFMGTSYRAANWRHVGSTTGRSRNDRYKKLHVPHKDVYVYPLRRDFRRALGQWT